MNLRTRFWLSSGVRPSEGNRTSGRDIFDIEEHELVSITHQTLLTSWLSPEDVMEKRDYWKRDLETDLVCCYCCSILQPHWTNRG